jgi:hypothetical protein
MLKKIAPDFRPGLSLIWSKQGMPILGIPCGIDTDHKLQIALFSITWDTEHLAVFSGGFAPF